MFKKAYKDKRGVVYPDAVWIGNVLSADMRPGKELVRVKFSVWINEAFYVAGEGDDEDFARTYEARGFSAWKILLAAMPGTCALEMNGNAIEAYALEVKDVKIGEEPGVDADGKPITLILAESFFANCEQVTAPVPQRVIDYLTELAQQG